MPTIVSAWNNARVFYQDGDEVPAEPAILIHTDNGGTLILQQEDRYLTVNRESLPALLKELKLEVKRD